MRRIITALIVFSLSASAVQAIDITTCGEVVGRGEAGVLLNDLTCVLPDTGVCEVDGTTPCARANNCPSGVCLGVAAVVLDGNASLDLNGFKVESTLGVECAGRRCEIGNGVVAGTSSAVCTGIWAYGSRVELSDLQVDGNGCSGVTNVGGKIDATNVTVEGAYVGINTRRLRGENITVNDSTIWGIAVSKKVKVDGLTVNGNGLGSIVDHFRGSNVVANGNGNDGLAATKFRGTNVEASNNAGAGVFSYRSGRIDGFAALENDGPGYESEKGGGRLTDATITSSLSTYDIETRRRPRLRGSSSCDRSLDTSTGGSWGICTLD